MPHITNLTPFQNGTSQRQVRHASVVLTLTWHFRFSFGLWSTRQETYNIHVTSSIFFVLGLCCIFLMQPLTLVFWRKNNLLLLLVSVARWLSVSGWQMRHNKNHKGSCVFVWVPCFNLALLFEVYSLDSLRNFHCCLKALIWQAKCNFEINLNGKLYPSLLFSNQMESFLYYGNWMWLLRRKLWSFIDLKNKKLIYELSWKVCPSWDEIMHLGVKCLAPGRKFSRNGL